jgi:hypothetical protein
MKYGDKSSSNVHYFQFFCTEHNNMAAMRNIYFYFDSGS